MHYEGLCMAARASAVSVGQEAARCILASLWLGKSTVRHTAKRMQQGLDLIGEQMGGVPAAHSHEEAARVSF